MLIETILHTKGPEVVTLSADASLREAARLQDVRRIGAIVVTDAAGEVAGVLSERDIVRAMAREGGAAETMRIRDAMTRDVITIGLRETLQAGLECMTDRRVRHLPVVDAGGRLAGLVSIGDLVKWKIAAAESEAEALKSYMAG